MSTKLDKENLNIEKQIRLLESLDSKSCEDAKSSLSMLVQHGKGIPNLVNYFCSSRSERALEILYRVADPYHNVGKRRYASTGVLDIVGYVETYHQGEETARGVGPPGADTPETAELGQPGRQAQPLQPYHRVAQSSRSPSSFIQISSRAHGPLWLEMSSRACSSCPSSSPCVRTPRPSPSNCYSSSLSTVVRLSLW